MSNIKSWTEKFFATYQAPTCVAYGTIDKQTDLDDVAIKCYVKKPTQLGQFIGRKPQVIVTCAGEWHELPPGRSHDVRQIKTYVFTDDAVSSAATMQYFSHNANFEIGELTLQNLEKTLPTAFINRQETPYVGVDQANIAPVLEIAKKSNKLPEEQAGLLNDMMDNFFAGQVPFEKAKLLINKMAA